MSPRRRGEPPPAAHPWPAVGSRVLIAVPGEQPRSTRVEDTTAESLAVAVPRSGRGELEPPLDGTPFELTWPGHRGLLVLPVVLQRRDRDQVPLWWLQPTGGVEVQQRRSFVRAPVDAPFPVWVSLEWELPDRGTAAGELLDLSEGGLRAHLTGAEAPRVPEGAGVAVRMTIVDSEDGSGVDVVEHELFGTVLRAGELPQEQRTVEVVVQLHDDAGQGDTLRRLVFAWQRRARRR